MIDLPNPNENESMGGYIRRLLENKIITQNQIPFAVKKYNDK
ncbi:hypothetical protein UFOVP185_28 [uncultured Caudovirales phage]|uniref:Uncharacterized protein n=1 Tax=uncultured Caudovirales phage TaxID=2100421 RepID=A0A6J7WJM5_9CAUD|nr:hypothetical protein UFOVP185_28 [uncultured Caudovirales phage]